MATLLRSISVPQLESHRGRTLLTVTGVALGVAVLVAVSTMNRAILHSIRATVSDLSGATDLQVQAGSSGFDDALVDQVRNIPGVRAARPVLEQTVRMSSGHGEERVLVLGL